MQRAYKRNCFAFPILWWDLYSNRIILWNSGWHISIMPSPDLITNTDREEQRNYAMIMVQFHVAL